MANTTEDKLAYLNGTKDTLKTNLIAKGMDVTDETPFRKMAQLVADIPSGGYVEGSSYEEITEQIGDGSFIDNDIILCVLSLFSVGENEFIENIPVLFFKDKNFSYGYNEDTVIEAINRNKIEIVGSSWLIEINLINGSMNNTYDPPYSISLNIIDISRPK